MVGGCQKVCCLPTCICSFISDHLVPRYFLTVPTRLFIGGGGKQLHRTCHCDFVMTAKGEPALDSTGAPRKDHRGLNTESHPLIKSWQLALGAVLRSAIDWKARDEYRDMSLVDIAIHGVEEMANHLTNVHDGLGFHTGLTRVCRLHERDAYTSRQYNDCTDFDLEMKEWLSKNVIEVIHDIIHEKLGAVSQNASERVGLMALFLRSKETCLNATQYQLRTNIAICLVQDIVIERFRLMLHDAGI